MRTLIAIKPMTYATRRLLPGDDFRANARDARVLTAIGKARESREPGSLLPPPDVVVAKATKSAPAKRGKAALDHDGNGKAGGSKAAIGDDLTELRREYADKVGKRPFPGWDAAELKRRIAEAG